MANYYCARLLKLEEIAEKFKGSYFYIESNELIDNTETVLHDLTVWLNLKEPLNKEYSIFENTGKPGHGDPSDSIKSGILHKAITEYDIDIPLDILQKTQYAYQRCLNTLSRNMS